jgi:fumarate hydratase subunit beta
VVRTDPDGVKRVVPPLSDDDVAALRAGDRVRLSGVLYTARDAAHARMAALLERGEPLPADLRGQIIYYTGPSPARPGELVGSIGPTTAGRMDPYTPALLALGLKGTMGKGARSEAVKAALRQHKAVYLGAVGGAGAVLSRHVRRVDVVAWEDLGTEAMRRLEVEDFPAMVINDCWGGDLYETGRLAWAREEA